MKQQAQMLTLLILLFCGNLKAQNTVTFQLDLRNENTILSAELRGSHPPLAWDKSLDLADEDKDGIYTVKVEFPESSTGEIVEYKFLRNSSWERDDIGNRELQLTGSPKVLHPSKWQIGGEDFHIKKNSKSEFGKKVFIYSSLKSRGMSAKEITLEMINFYEWYESDFPSEPIQLIGVMEKGQSGQDGGYFEVLEMEKERVKFIIGRYWLKWFENYGPGLGMDEDGVIQGVSKEDIETYYTTWLEHWCTKDSKNWNFDIKEDGEMKWIVTISEN